MRLCDNCKAQLPSNKRRYCSNQCQSDYSYKNYIDNWKNSIVSGNRGINVKNLSGHIIRYITDKYNGRCVRCGWCKVNPITNKSSLEIDHIDGNSDNNTEDNLILLCPNCHSLTINYKNLNKGHGRLWRREKYVKID